MRLRILALAAVAGLVASSISALAQDQPISIVAGENVYGDIAEQLGGAHVKVRSLISNPGQDPHLFEASPSAVRALAEARIVIGNGADYDPWLDRLLQASPRTGRIEINVAALLDRKPGDNPHLWYDPAAIPALCNALASALQKIDSSHSDEYRAGLARVLASLRPVEDRVASMRLKYKGVAITATEPVFGPMLDAVGLINRNQRFQLAMMNDTEPSAKDVAAFERGLRQHLVKVLLNNTQVSEPVSKRLVSIAQSANVPVVGVTETLPPNKHFQAWVLGELDALDQALAMAK
jgi:zinc/manganese transport system substrate-binding protein